MKGVLGGLIALILIAAGLRFVYSRVISAATTDTDTSPCLMLRLDTPRYAHTRDGRQLEDVQDGRSDLRIFLPICADRWRVPSTAK